MMKAAKLLVNGVWTVDPVEIDQELKGVRNKVEAKEDALFLPTPGRYHLYVSDACPWCHRTILMRKLKGLEDVISMSAVATLKADESWEFSDERPDPLFQATRLHQIYTKHDPNYTGRVSVPVLWDKERQCIVSTESADIMLMFNSEFNDYAKHPEVDLYPSELVTEIDAINEVIFQVNIGVYRCGLAESDIAYQQAKQVLFEHLNKLEQILVDKQFLVAERLTIADLRLFATLIRFDQVYYPFFRCNEQEIKSYPNLSKYLRFMYLQPGIGETVNFTEIMDHYYGSFPKLDASHRPISEVPELLVDLVAKRDTADASLGKDMPSSSSDKAGSSSGGMSSPARLFPSVPTNKRDNAASLSFQFT